MDPLEVYGAVAATYGAVVATYMLLIRRAEFRDSRQPLLVLFARHPYDIEHEERGGRNIYTTGWDLVVVNRLDKPVVLLSCSLFYGERNGTTYSQPVPITGDRVPPFKMEGGEAFRFSVCVEERGNLDECIVDYRVQIKHSRSTKPATAQVSTADPEKRMVQPTG